MNSALALTVAITRGWVGLYTLRLPLEVREARRGEIDSDLWEQQWLASRRGDPAVGTAIEVLARMLFGIISDITWRAQAGASARQDRRLKLNERFFIRAGIGSGVVLAFLLLLGSWYWLLAGAIVVAVVLPGMAFLDTRRAASTMRTGDQQMTTNPNSHRKWLVFVIGVCIATIAGMWAYASSLEDWGDLRTMIFTLGSLAALITAFVASVLLVADLFRARSTQNR